MPITAYLAGPINGRTDAECIDWRESAKALLGETVKTLDPMARDYRGREREANIDREIVEGDKSDIDQSDLLLVMYDKPSVGTSMEVLYAFTAGIPIVIVNESGANLSPWLTYHATQIYATLEAACMVIQNGGIR